MLVVLSAVCVVLTAASLFYTKKPAINKAVFWLEAVAIVISLFYTKTILKKPEVVDLVISIPLAYGIYMVSLFIVGTKFSKSSLLFFGLRSFDTGEKRLLFGEIARNFKTSGFEELIFRGIMQYTLYMTTKNIPLTITIAAIYFTACHYRRKRPIVQYMDIAVFSLVITVLFQITYDIWLVMAVHTFRNLFIICEKHIHINKTQKRLMQLSRKIRNLRLTGEHEQ